MSRIEPPRSKNYLRVEAILEAPLPAVIAAIVLMTAVVIVWAITNI
jgi:hypothetical protein